MEVGGIEASLEARSSSSYSSASLRASPHVPDIEDDIYNTSTTQQFIQVISQEPSTSPVLSRATQTGPQESLIRLDSFVVAHQSYHHSLDHQREVLGTYPFTYNLI